MDKNLRNLILEAYNEVLLEERQNNVMKPYTDEAKDVYEGVKECGDKIEMEDVAKVTDVANSDVLEAATSNIKNLMERMGMNECKKSHGKSIVSEYFGSSHYGKI